jgi:hypothetical protein
MVEADFFQGVLSNAAWDFIKWVAFIAGGGSVDYLRGI